MAAADPPVTIELHRTRPRWFGRSPFAAAAPAIVSAVGFGLATVTWIVAGGALPGGRWLAVHLFTLGVLTPLVVAFSQHFAARFCPTPTALAGDDHDDTRWSWTTIGLLDLAVLATVTGRATDLRPAMALGATGVTAVVLVGWWRLRRRRHRAPDGRFTWIVRVYERAHGAFVHGAVLGVVLGLGLVPATWYLGVRQAHLHAMILGWGGLTLLATLVVFGPGTLGTGGWFDALGVVVLVAVLGRSLLTVLVFLAPVLRGRSPAAREALRRRAERGALARSLAIDLGVVAVVVGLATVGWGLIAVSVVAHLAVVLAPPPRTPKVRPG